MPQGTIRATVLIETILAAFEMEEILYELRDHSAGLNCGRWDYIFSCIKKFRSRPDFVLADRALVTMTTHFMNSYSLLAIKTCHRRGAHAIGGMAAQIPIKNDPVANEEALAKVRADKEREARNGHDGTWVAHPGLVPIAVEAFDAVMPGPNQIDRKLRRRRRSPAKDLLTFEPEGPITEGGLRVNISVGVQYLGAWLNGIGCVPINNLMEDAATAEISRSQVWQWIHSDKGVLDDGRKVDTELFRALLAEELDKIHAAVPGEPALLLRPRRGALRRDLHLGRLRRVPDAAGLRPDRLNRTGPPLRPAAGGGMLRRPWPPPSCSCATASPRTRAPPPDTRTRPGRSRRRAPRACAWRRPACGRWTWAWTRWSPARWCAAARPARSWPRPWAWSRGRTPRLAPGMDIDGVEDLLIEHPDAETMLLCGHQPDLSLLVAALTAGGSVEFRKGVAGRAGHRRPAARRRPPARAVPAGRPEGPGGRAGLAR